MKLYRQTKFGNTPETNIKWFFSNAHATSVLALEENGYLVIIRANTITISIHVFIYIQKT
jgi:hypothetical protein